jgi:septal ring factor EnvC (AmiA/AmiB activator)
MQSTRRVIKRIPASLIALAAAWAVVSLISVSGCSSSKPQTKEERIQASSVDLRKTLQDTIKDTDRLQQMLAIIDRASASIEADATELATDLREQDRLNADYNASLDDFRKIGERLEALRKKHRSAFLSARQSLAQLATDDEWKKISSRDLELLSL